MTSLQSSEQSIRRRATVAAPAKSLSTLIAEYSVVEREHAIACRVASKAVDAYLAARPPVPSELEYNEAAKADGIFCFASCEEFKRPISEREIRAAIDSITSNHTLIEERDAAGRAVKFQIDFTATVPMTDDDRATISRLENRLAAAVAYEAACTAARCAAGVQRIEAEADRLSDKMFALIDKIARTPAKDRASLVAKISAYQKNKDFHLPEMARAIIRDTARLLAS